MDLDFNPANLKENYARIIQYFELLDDPTRMRILFFLYLYPRLSLTQLSILLHRTKPAVSHQIKKFVEIGIIKITQLPFQGNVAENFYELVNNFEEKIRLNPARENPSNLSKDTDILLFQAIKGMFKFTSNMFMHFTEFYQKLEDRVRKFKDPIEIPTLGNYIQILPLSRKGYELCIHEVQKITERIFKLQEEEDKMDFVERPMIYIATIFPIKALLSFKD